MCFLLVGSTGQVNLIGGRLGVGLAGLYHGEGNDAGRRECWIWAVVITLQGASDSVRKRSQASKRIQKFRKCPKESDSV